MSAGQTIRLTNASNRSRAALLCHQAPIGAGLNIRPPSRTGEQNSKFWAMLSDVSRAKPEGRELTPDVWKALFLHSLDHAQRFEMALDGKGMVPVGFRSSRLTKEQMGDLLTVIEEYAARHGIEFSDGSRDRDTHPKGGDANAAPFMGSPAPKGIAQTLSSRNPQ
jgi:hypothetical protein